MHVMRDRPEAAERHGAGHVARCTARAAHGRPGPARRPPRQVPAHHAQRTARAVPGRPGQAPLRGVCSGWAVGCRHSPASGRCPLLCTYPLRVGLCGFRDRRVLPEDHRLADHLPASVHRPGPRRPENGYLAAPARGRRPDGPGAPLATAACSTGPSATGRPCPRPRRSPRWVPRETSFRLRPDRGTQLAVQGRAHPLARAPGRTSTPPVLATAEWVHWYGHHPATLRHRHANPHRARSRLGTRHPPPRTITTGNHRHQTNQPPQNPRLDTPAILDGSGAPDLENLSRPGEVHPLGCLDRFDGVPHPPPVAWSRAARR